MFGAANACVTAEVPDQYAAQRELVSTVRENLNLGLLPSETTQAYVYVEQ